MDMYTIMGVATGISLLLIGLLVVFFALRKMSRHERGGGFLLFEGFLILGSGVPAIICISGYQQYEEYLAKAHLEYYIEHPVSQEVYLIPGAIALALLAIPLVRVIISLPKVFKGIWEGSKEIVDSVKTTRGGLSVILGNLFHTISIFIVIGIDILVGLMVIGFIWEIGYPIAGVLIGGFVGFLLFCFSCWLASLGSDKREWRVKLEQQLDVIDHWVANPGNEKRADVYVQEANRLVSYIELLEKEETLKYKEVSDNMNVLKKRERDWASAGGAASAIGGVGAGIVTAINVEAQNVHIRDYNAFIGSIAHHNAMEKTRAYRAEIAEKEQELKDVKKKIEVARAKKVEMIPGDQLLKLLRPRIVKQKRDEHNVLWITVEIQAADPKSKGKAKYVVDGVFRAVLKKGDKRVGEALFMLPVDGSARRQCLDAFATRINSYKLKVPAHDRIELEPASLWAIEQ